LIDAIEALEEGTFHDLRSQVVPGSKPCAEESYSDVIKRVARG
jgi:hypothetical protein